MSLTFYFASGSPFAWRVWLALEHKQIAYQAKRLLFDRAESRSPEFLAVNPRGKVPAIDHDGFVLRESGVILEYLEDRWPERSLLARDPTARAIARLWAREADECLYPPLRRLLSQMFRREGEPDQAEVTAAKADLPAELARIEHGLTGDWLAGELSLADFTTYPHLRMLRRVGERLPQHAADELIGPRTAAWMARIEALPYFARTIPPHWRD